MAALQGDDVPVTLPLRPSSPLSHPGNNIDSRVPTRSADIETFPCTALAERLDLQANDGISSGQATQRGSIEHTSRSSRVQIVLPLPNVLNRKLIKDLECHVYGNCVSSQLTCKRLLEAVDGNPKGLALYLYHRPSYQQLLFIQYCQARQRFRLSRDDDSLLFDENTNLRGSTLLSPALKFLKLVAALPPPLLLLLKSHLTETALVGRWQDPDELLFSHLISSNNESVPFKEFRQFLDRYSLRPFTELAEPAANCASRLELAYGLLELEHRTSSNRHCRRHSYVRLSGQGCSAEEYLLLGAEQLLLEAMQFALVTGEAQFVPAQRSYFPACYYSSLYEQLLLFPECSLDLCQRIKALQYCYEEDYSLERLLVSPHLGAITAIEPDRFQNFRGNTYLVYLIIGPVGLGKSELVSAMCRKAIGFGCSAIVLSRSGDTRVGSFDGSEVEEHFRKSDRHFSSSRICVVLLDYPFQEQLPEQLLEAVDRSCPADCHYKIFHVMPQSQPRLKFEDDILQREVEFPFSAELIIYCLRSIQGRKCGAGLTGNGVESLARALHYTSSAFKNYQPLSHANCRVHLIRVAFRVQFQHLRPNLVRYLEQLLSVSFKKEYDRNESLLHYFLSEIEELEELNRPDSQAIVDEVFTSSFPRLPYFPL